jgi:hypothetical protein
MNMGIFTFEKSNREQELQNEIDSKDILIAQNQMQIKKLETQLKEKEEEQLKDENAIKRLAVERDELARTNAELEIEKTSLYYELEEIKEEKEKEKNFFEKLIETLKEKLSKKDANLKDEQRKKGKYKFYFEHGAVDFSKAIVLFNALTGANLSETKVRTYLVQNNIIYKAGRYYAPTPYAEDFNYVVVYGEYGTTPPKYTHEFLIYLKQKVDEGNL